MALIFQDAEKAKNAIMASQQKEIAKLYDEWADDILDKAIFYSHKTNASAAVSEKYYKELFKQMNTQSNLVSKEAQGIITSNMYAISDAVVKSNVEWLKTFGFDEKGLNAAFSYIPDDVVKRLITGQIYQGGWNLSQRIWTDNQQTQKDIYQIMARGLTEQKSVYEIAKDLESYVRPSARLPWNPVLAMKNTKTGKIEYKRIYKKQVDYNAQRLARTLAQHSYQQSFIATTQKNPFITEYIWHSNGSRPCELCQSRDGVHYKKDELPMDHPNGMCIMEPKVAEDMVDQLADWFNSPDGTYPEIDEFAGNFGYDAKKLSDVKTPIDFVNKYGKSDKSLAAWHNSMTPIQKAEAKMLKEQAGQTWQQWYEQNVYTGVGPSKLSKAAKIAASKVDDVAAVAKSSIDASDLAVWDDMIVAQRDRGFLAKMRGLEDEWESGLTKLEKQAVHLYTKEGSNCYRQQNGFLRFGMDVDDDVKRTVKRIQSALDKSITTEDMMLVRGTKTSLYTDIFKGNLKTALDTGNVDAMAGEVFRDPGFLSTSPSGDEFSGNLKFKIFAPAGTKGGYVERNNFFSEREFLLQSNTTYYVEKAEFDDYGDIVMYLRILV